MTNEILKLIRKTNKKSFKLNRKRDLNYYNTYPYVSAYNSKVVGYVHKNRKAIPQIKRCSYGPEKYIVRVSDKGIEISITKLNIKIFKTEGNVNSIFPDEELIFEGSNITKDDHFNISMILPNVPTPDEFVMIRQIMERKDTKYNRIYMYMSKDWMS